MNEMDVREEVIRPLLHRLGYSHSGEAYIRTEQKLSYPFSQLGRKKPLKDPPLRGRADYICGVALAGKWVIEAKPSDDPMDFETAAQAQSYAAHPEISALFFLITNGQRFKLFQTSILDKPVLDWTLEDINANFIKLYNLVGPSAIRKHSKRFAIDAGKPLAQGLSSSVRIIGGSVKYEEQETTSKIFSAKALEGVTLPIVGGLVQRSLDGKIHGHLKMAEVAPLLKSLHTIMGASEGYDFYSDSEYLSSENEFPTLFDNVTETITPRGTLLEGVGALPFTIECRAVTLVSGVLAENWFKGEFKISCSYICRGVPAHLAPVFPKEAANSASGRFEVELL